MIDRLGGETIGTTWSAQIVAAPPGIAADIAATLAMVVAQMSHWDPDSQLGRFNAAAIGQWHAIAPEFAQVVATALDIAGRSGGAFDPALGALVDLWGFGPPGPRSDIPGDSEIARARAASGRDGLEFDPLLLRLRRTRPARLDLSGIAKGYAVDAIAARLRTRGCTDFLVEIGGEWLGEGIRPDGQPWWIDVETPPGIAMPMLRVALHGLAVATSGDYRRSFDHAGVRLAHSIDPRTGRPIANGVASVTVLHSSCMHADAWASALTILGPDAGVALAEREHLAAHMLVRDGPGEFVSPALRAMLD